MINDRPKVPTKIVPPDPDKALQIMDKIDVEYRSFFNGNGSAGLHLSDFTISSDRHVIRKLTTMGKVAVTTKDNGEEVLFIVGGLER